jgi:hypothetical protein
MKSHLARANPAMSALCVAIGLFTLAGCSRDLPPAPERVGSSASDGSGLRGTPEAGAGIGIESNGRTPPAELVSVQYNGKSVTVWPYTGASFNGVASDPINLIFVGHADPVGIRAALLALDGDRSAFGFPSVPPFNARWSDAVGDVQTAYADGAGWLGSVIQLQLGAYGPVRAHLRLFKTGVELGSGGEWTLGGAHFEVVIPGTTEHQVLSWELAQQLVTVDLIRSGLLAAGGPAQSEPINLVPSFREIPDFIYNQLPPDLIAAIGGPAQPVSGAVPLASDGRASILNLEKAPTVTPGIATQSFTIDFAQAIPKPFCSDGPLDWVYVTGPIQFEKTAEVDERGRYRYVSRVGGRITVTPVDITTSPPTPVGAPFAARVSDVQEGFVGRNAEAVSATSKRIARESGGSEVLVTNLKVATHGPDHYRAITRCLESEP